MDKVKTWGQAMDFTFSNKPEWKHGNGSKTARYNCNHFTRLQGLSFPVNRIRPAIMLTVGNELEAEGKSNATINRVISAVSTAIRFCASVELCEMPPPFVRRKESEGRKLYFTKDQVDRMALISTEVFGREDLRDIILFAAYTGMRQSEILKIRAKDIDWNQHRIKVGGVEGQWTKSKDNRSIPIHPKLVDILANRCSQSTRKDVRLFGDEWRDRYQLLNNFKKVVRLIDLNENHYVFHVLRHSYATWLGEAGVPVHEIMALCGHSRVETTLRYTKPTDPALKRAMGLI